MPRGSEKRKPVVTRPHTTPARQNAATSAMNRKAYMEQFELLEYEWPDLPPVHGFKEAITRQRVSKGMSYLLPVDKTKSSVEGVYRTDLRMMFRDPYVRDDQQYDDLKVRASAKYHFIPNTPHSVVRTEALNPSGYRLAAESERVRQQYSYSAPVTGQKGYLDADPKAMRQRSNLYLPLKVKVPPELIKLKEEADKIVQSLQGEPQENYRNGASLGASSGVEADLPTADERDAVHALYKKMLSETGEPAVHRPHSQPAQKTRAFRSFEEIRRAKPAAPHLPESVQSPYLNYRQSSNIWSWLHRDEKISDFDYFLSVCS